MSGIGLHKQVVNRILEPFQWMHTIVTATAWSNFFKLRLHPAADPNIHELARVMKEAMEVSTPTERMTHTPYVGGLADEYYGLASLISAARCARVSYLNHDGSVPDAEKDIALACMLKDAGHASPFEHVAFADEDDGAQWANLRGWCSYRSQEGI